MLDITVQSPARVTSIYKTNTQY